MLVLFLLKTITVVIIVPGSILTCYLCQQSLKSVGRGGRCSVSPAGTRRPLAWPKLTLNRQPATGSKTWLRGNDVPNGKTVTERKVKISTSINKM